MKRLFISKRHLLGSLAKWATNQSPYPRPDNLEKVLDEFHKIITSTWGKNYVKEFKTEKEIRDFCKEHLRKIPEYMLWNERKNGRQGNGFSAAEHHDNGEVTFYNAKADDDFIDLDALERNIVVDICSDLPEENIPTQS